MYYLLDTDYFVKPVAFRTDVPDPPFRYAPSYWIRGRTMKAPPAPLRVQLWERGGNGMAEMFLDSIPLFRDDLLATLRAAGADNLEGFPVVLLDPHGAEIHGYQAVNIVGLVKCADLSKSQFDDITGTGMVAMGFRKLVIDEQAAGGTPLFRLAEAVASIIVHEQVKAAVDAKSFRYLTWRALG